MAEQTRHMLNEADVGSGEKPPAQKELEKEQQAVGKNPPGETQDGSRLAHQVIEEQEYADQRPDPEPKQGAPRQESSLPGRILQSGDHIARIVAMRLPDDTFEAQVYVRLAREPEIAETYIPAGIYATEDEAWAAAQARADRAFKEHEF